MNRWKRKLPLTLESVQAILRQVCRVPALCVQWLRPRSPLSQPDPLLINKRLALLTSTIISVTFVSLLLFYTRGNLLYGGDYVGYFSVSQFLLYPTPTAAVFCGAILLAGSNVYIGFYLGLFLSTLFVELAVFTFAEQLSRQLLPRGPWGAVPIIASVLFIFSPYTITDTFKSLISSVFPYVGFEFLFFALCIRVLDLRLRGSTVPTRTALALGVTLGLSLESFPNNFRVGILGIVALVAILSVRVSSPLAPPALSISTRMGRAALFVLALVASGFYTMYPYLGNLSGLISSSSVIVGSISSNSFFVGGTYNSLSNVLRLLGPWGFWSGFAPYSNLYTTSPLLIVASWAWPALAIFAPLLLRRRLRKFGLVILTELIVVFCVAWDTSTNPPLGNLYSELTYRSPLLLQLFPTGFLTDVLLAKLFPVLAAVSIVVLGSILTARLKGVVHITSDSQQRETNRVIVGLHRVRPSRTLVVVTASLVAFLLIPAYPTFAGLSEGQYFNESAKGFSIPNTYFQARPAVISLGGKTLLFPPTSTYISTNWNYEGSVDFYSDFFYPAPVLTLDTLSAIGGYGEYMPSAISLQSRLSNVLIPNNATLSLAPSKLAVNDSLVWGTDATVSGSTVQLNESLSPHIQLSVPISRPLNASSSKAIQFVIESPEASTLLSDFSKGTAMVGLSSLSYNSSVGSTTGWYFPGSDGFSYAYLKDNKTLTVELLTGMLNKLYETDEYNDTSIYYLDLIVPANGPGFVDSVGFGSLGLISALVPSPSWIRLVSHLGIRGLLVDTSIDSGLAPGAGQALAASSEIVAAGDGRVVYSGGSITVIELTL